MAPTFAESSDCPRYQEAKEREEMANPDLTFRPTINERSQKMYEKSSGRAAGGEVWQVRIAINPTVASTTMKYFASIST